MEQPRIQLTQFDTLIKDSSSEDRPSRRRMNAMQSVERTVGYCTFEKDRARIANMIVNRREINGFESEEFPESAGFAIIKRIYRGDIKGRTQEVWPKVSHQEKKDIANYMLHCAYGQEMLLPGAPIVEVPTVDEMNIGLTYTPTDWEGVGGINIFLGDPHIQVNGQYEPYVPVHILRGNPYATAEGLEFHVRTSQPWISEIAPSITAIEKNYSEIPEAHELIREKWRLTDKLRRRLDKESNGLFRFRDLTLLAGLAYLQARGVQTFRGIDYSKHPQVTLNKTLPDYDDLFKKWFDGRTEDSQHPWVLDTSFSKGYIPHWDQVPPTAKAILIGIYQQAS